VRIKIIIMYMLVKKDGCVSDSYDLLGWMDVYLIVGNTIVKDI